MMPVAAGLAAATALVVDDDQDMCRVMELALAGVGCVATTAGSARRAIALATRRAFPVAFIDARLPDMDGWRLIEELRQRRPAIRIILVSGYYFADDIRIAEALQAGKIDGFLAKPFRVEAIVAAALGCRTGTVARSDRAAGPASTFPTRPAGGMQYP